MTEREAETTVDMKIEIAEALFVKPGDRVLLLVKDDRAWTQETVAHAQQVLKERFPDVTFAFCSGVDQAIIEPSGE